MKQIPIIRCLSFFLTMWFFFPLMVLANESVGLTRYAIIIGANNGGKGRIPLLYSHRDAESMSKVMEELGGLKKEDTRLLLDPTPEEIAGTFDQIARILHDEKERGGKSHLLFYYSGHSDEQGLLLGGKKFSYAELRKRLDLLDSDVRISIVDSCASGGHDPRKRRHMATAFLDRRIIRHYWTGHPHFQFGRRIRAGVGQDRRVLFYPLYRVGITRSGRHESGQTGDPQRGLPVRV